MGWIAVIGVTAAVDTAGYSSGMSIPVHREPPESGLGAGRAGGEWSSLTGEEKRERLLAAAAWCSHAHGLEAPMSDVAEAAGAGVASVYRLYPSKYELLAALVVRRMDQIADAAARRASLPGDRWSALTRCCATSSPSSRSSRSSARPARSSPTTRT